ncbi:MAG: hypothetical protein K6U74_16510 [Firmicutes bacterium]|nr:hypothetical protein [Bacillota bacterium]
MAKKKVLLFSFLLFLGLLASAVGGFFTGRFISGMPEVDVRLNWWWKLSTLNFFLASLYVTEFLLPVKSLPIKNLAGPPRSRIEFLKHIALAKQTLLVCVLTLPALAVSIVAGSIPAILAISYLPAMVIVALIACTWGTVVDLSPTVRKIGWKRNLIYSVILLLFSATILIFTITIPKVSNFIWETVIGQAIFLSLFVGIGFLCILEDSYRSVRKDLAEMDDNSR